MKWASIEGVDDYTLRMHAAARRLVKMHNGRIAILVSWPGNQHRRGRYCRLETTQGNRYTLRCELVAEMDVDDG